MGLEIINQLKKQKGFTNEDLSSMSGVPKGTIDKITAGTTKDPKLETLKAIARVLNCSLNDFGEEKSPSDSVPKAKGLEPDEHELVADYRLLNENGKEAARNAVHGFTTIPVYKKSTESKFLEENA